MLSIPREGQICAETQPCLESWVKIGSSVHHPNGLPMMSNFLLGCSTFSVSSLMSWPACVARFVLLVLPKQSRFESPESPLNSHKFTIINGLVHQWKAPYLMGKSMVSCKISYQLQSTSINFNQLPSSIIPCRGPPCCLPDPDSSRLC